MKPTILLFSAATLPLASLFAQNSNAPTQSFKFDASYSGSSATQVEGRSVGDLGLNFFDADIGIGSFALGEGRFSYGVSMETIGVDADAVVPVKSSLFGAGLTGSYGMRVFEDKRLIAQTTVGIYGNGVNVSGAVLVQGNASETLSWTAGLIYSAQGRFPVLPVVGLDWEFAPKFNLRTGAPRTEVSYQVSPELQASVGVSLAGGTYRMNDIEDPHFAAGKFNDEWLDVREIRVGPAVRWQISPEASVGIEAGLVADRTLEYDDLDIQIRSDDTFYAGLSGSLRF